MNKKNYLLSTLAKCLAVMLCVGLSSCSKDDDDGNRDTEAPSIYILNPTSEDVYVTTDNSIFISGTAQDNNGLKSITYTSSGGANGTADGLEEWNISNLQLVEGDNKIEITATDESNNKNTANITITKNQYLTFLGVPFVDNDVIYTNEDTELWITVSIAPNDNLVESSVRLIEVDDNNNEVEEICTMYDDGNLKHGDEIKGDNVFSTKHTFKFEYEGSRRYRISAKTKETEGEVEGTSAVFTLTALDKIKAEQQVRSMMETQQTIEEKLTAISGLPTEEKEKEMLTWIKDNPSIVEVTKVDGMLKLVHSSGLTSYVVIDENNNYKGGIHEDKRRNAPSIPISQQTRGNLIRTTSNIQQTRATGTNIDATIIQNKNVLIWAPFQGGEGAFSKAMEPSLRTIFNNSPVELKVDYITNENCNRASIQKFTNYGIVVLDTHGKGGDLIFTREKTGFVSDLMNQFDEQGFVYNFISNLYCLVTMGNYDNTYTYYAVTSKFIQNKIKGNFPNSIIFNGSCESFKTLKLCNAFINKGAKTYLGFKEIVSVDKCIEKADQFFTALTGDDLKKTGEAYHYDKFWDEDHENVYMMAGSQEMHFYLGLINGDFEYGNMNGWNVSGDGRVITQLGSQRPTQGYYMGIVSTGLGYTENYGSISQTFRVTNENTLSIRWNFLSEEFMEYVGTPFQDYLKITIKDGSNTEVIFAKAIDNFASQYSLPKVSPGIVFDKGDVYMTGWQTSTFNISKYKGKTITLIIESGDIGDSIYDSATLLDEIKIY